jgi:hypothetical protein
LEEAKLSKRTREKSEKNSVAMAVKKKDTPIPSSPDYLSKQ